MDRYMEQVARAERYYRRMEKAKEGIYFYADDSPYSIHRKDSLDEYLKDDAMSFFIHCHNIRDWITKDPELRCRVNQLCDRVKQNNFYESAPLKICAKISNGLKHLDPSHPGVGGPRQMGIKIGGEFQVHSANFSVSDKWPKDSDPYRTVDALELANCTLQNWYVLINDVLGENVGTVFPLCKYCPKSTKGKNLEGSLICGCGHLKWTDRKPQ